MPDKVRPRRILGSKKDRVVKRKRIVEEEEEAEDEEEEEGSEDGENAAPDAHMIQMQGAGLMTTSGNGELVRLCGSGTRPLRLRVPKWGLNFGMLLRRR